MPAGPQPKKTAEPERTAEATPNEAERNEQRESYDDEESAAAEQRPPSDS